MSVGSLAVQMLYRFYVVGHLSKWFTFSVYVVRLLVVVSSFRLAYNVIVTAVFECMVETKIMSHLVCEKKIR